MGGAAAILAGGAGWWVASQFFHSQPSQSAVVPVDKHCILKFPLPAYSGDIPATVGYAWLPDSTHIACVTQQSEIFLVNVKSGQVTWKQQLPSSSNTLLIHWSTDGTHALIAGKNAAYVQNVSLEEQQIIWSGPHQLFSTSINSMNENEVWVHSSFLDEAIFIWRAFSPDETLVAAADPLVNDTVEIWNVQEERRIAECQPSLGNFYTSVVDFAMAWAPDSASLAVHTSWFENSSSSLPTLTTWHASDGRLIWASHIDSLGSVGGIKWSPDSSALACSLTADTRLAVLDGQTGTIRFQTSLAPAPYVYPQTERHEIFAWSPDSTRLALFAVEKGSPVIQIWDAKTGRHLFTCQRVQAQPGNIFWSPDGRYLVATEADQSLVGGFPPSAAIIQFWDAQSGKALFAYTAPEFPESLLWSPDSRFVAVHTTTSHSCQPIGWGHQICSATYALQVFQVR